VAVSLSINPRSPTVPLPDLTVSAVEAPSQGTVGKSIPINFIVKNQGNGPSGPIQGIVSLSTQAYGTDVYLGSFSVDSIGAGSSRQVSTSVTPHSATPLSRNYYVTVFIDSFGKVKESDKGNNIGSTYPKTITIASSSPTIAELITREATGGVPVTVDGQWYFIFTLKNRIDPTTLKVIPNSGATRVYVDAQNYPVSDPEIARKIAIIELAWRFQENVGSSRNLAQRQQNLNDRWLALKNVKYEDEAVRVVNDWFSRNPGLGVIKDWVFSWIKEKIWDSLNEARKVADEDVRVASAYYLSAQKVASTEIEDYRVARGYLGNILKGEVYEDLGLTMLYKVEGAGKSKLQQIGELFGEKLLGKVAGKAFKEGKDIVVKSVEMTLQGVDNFNWLTDHDHELSSRSFSIESDLSHKCPLTCTDTLQLALSPSITIEAHSPVELRVHDSQGRVTGMVNGEQRNEIPYSSYYENTVTLFLPADSYRFEIGGTGKGSYGVTVTRVAGQQINRFTADKVPTAINAVHTLAIDWDTLSQPNRLPIQLDSDGDGVFEDTAYLTSEASPLFSLPTQLVDSISLVVNIIAGFMAIAGLMLFWYAMRLRSSH
jgi:hypothetical protein